MSTGTSKLVDSIYVRSSVASTLFQKQTDMAETYCKQNEGSGPQDEIHALVTRKNQHYPRKIISNFMKRSSNRCGLTVLSFWHVQVNPTSTKYSDFSLKH